MNILARENWRGRLSGGRNTYGGRAVPFPTPGEERKGRRGSGMFFDALEGGASSQAVEGDGCCKTGKSVDKEYVM